MISNKIASGLHGLYKIIQRWIILYKPWRPEAFLFEIIINFLISFFRFIWMVKWGSYTKNSRFRMRKDELLSNRAVWKEFANISVNKHGCVLLNSNKINGRRKGTRVSGVPNPLLDASFKHAGTRQYILPDDHTRRGRASCMKLAGLARQRWSVAKLAARGLISVSVHCVDPLMVLPFNLQEGVDGWIYVNNHSNPKQIITKGFSTVFYPTGYSEWPKKKSIKIWPIKIRKSTMAAIGRENR